MPTTDSILSVNASENAAPTELMAIQANLGDASQGDALTRRAESDVQHPSGYKLFLICLALMLILLLAGLDINILATAVPTICDHFHTVADVGWYNAAYRLSSSSLQFPFGRLYKLYPTKPIFLASIVTFLCGSTICATAVSSHMFILGRAVSGAGVAGSTQGLFSLLTELVPLRKRPLYAGVSGAVEGVAGIAAPALGGLITQNLSWRWCFWINLPLGGVGLLAMYFLLPASDSAGEREHLTWTATLHKLDLVGTLFFVPSLAALFIAFNWAGIVYSWGDPKIIALFIVFGILLCAFVLDQIAKGDKAILPLRVLKNRSVIAGFIFSICVASSLTLWEYYAPTYFQVVHDWSPARSGYMMLPCLVGTLIGLLLQGSGTTYFGYYTPFVITSSILLSIGAGLLTTWSPSTQLSRLISYFALVGFAAGIGFMGPQNSVQTVLSKADMPLGLSVVLFAQNFGPALFISIAQAIFTNRLSANLYQLAPNANTTDLASLGFSEIKAKFQANELNDVVLAFSESISQTWFLALGLACFSIFGSLLTDWKSVKQKET